MTFLQFAYMMIAVSYLVAVLALQFGHWWPAVTPIHRRWTDTTGKYRWANKRIR